MTAGEYREILGDRIQAEAHGLAARWLERLRALLPVAKNEVFPSPVLLDHIPAVLQQVGAYLRSPEDEEIGTNTAVVEKARELGMLRFSQNASIHQLMREYEILGHVLAEFTSEETRRLDLTASAADCVEVMGRMNRAVQVLMQTTVDTFIAEYTDTITQQTARLESFNRMVSHELRNPLGTLVYVVALLRNEELLNDGARRTQVLDMAQRNVERIRDLLLNLENLTRLRRDDEELPSLQQVEIEAIAGEVARQLDEVAAGRGVEIRIAKPLPTALIDPARTELVLMNLISNGIKYSDPAKPARWVEVTAREGAPAGHFVICVRDNGIGIPGEAMPQIFTRFFRAHAERDGDLGVEGSGLGLSIVQDCLAALGGTIEVESREGEGTLFVMTLPSEGPAAKA